MPEMRSGFADDRVISTASEESLHQFLMFPRYYLTIIAPKTKNLTTMEKEMLRTNIAKNNNNTVA
jgi:hypothetical protein